MNALRALSVLLITGTMLLAGMALGAIIAVAAITHLPPEAAASTLGLLSATALLAVKALR
jgi:hypothetical protein